MAETDEGPVGVLGGGSWGTTLAHLIAQNGQDVLLWLRSSPLMEEINTHHTNGVYLPGYPLSQRVVATNNLEEVAGRSRVIFIAVPSYGLRPIAYELGNYVNGRHILIHGVKGIEPGSFQRMSEILREETPCRKVGILSGPNLAKEVIQKQPSATVIASHYEEVIEVGQKLLVSSSFRVYGSRDVIGVEIGGAVKNILAICAGMAHGLGYGENTRALLLTRGLSEISRLGVHLGAHPLTFSGLSGMGDLVATCFSPLSRNYQVGLRIAHGESLEAILASMVEVAEGVRTTRTVHEYALHQGISMPLTEGTYRILFQKVSPADAIGALMARSHRYELDPGLVMAT